MKVADIMTQRVITISATATVIDAVKAMNQSHIHSLIVEPETRDDAYGIVSAADIVTKVLAQGENPRRTLVSQILTKPCIVLNPDLSVTNAAKLLSQHQIHSAPVIQGDLLGIVSMTDLLEQETQIVADHRPELVAQTQQLNQTAHSVCKQYGNDSIECYQAWNLVDALQARLTKERAADLEVAPYPHVPADALDPPDNWDLESWCSG